MSTHFANLEEKLERAFVDEQTGIRGYVLTGQEQLLEPYRAAPASRATAR
jgi:CHASE3 domain sensor protein